MNRLVMFSPLLFIAASFDANAALMATSNLSISPGIWAGDSERPASGSWFALNLGAWVYTAIEGQNGIDLGMSQLSDAVPSGNVDMPWEFLGYAGAHQISSPVAIISDDNAGHVILDFGGWNFIQPGIQSWPAEIGFGGTNTFASMTCADTCANGDSFVLNFSSEVPAWFYDAGNAGGMSYQLHIEGMVTSVPLPAAFWLFGSGLLGLIGAARRRVT